MLIVIKPWSDSNCDSPIIGDFRDLDNHKLEATLTQRQESLYCLALAVHIQTALLYKETSWAEQ